ncbi:DNA repair protein XRCC1 [Contarinia nasturtii]|uniref:DNA repair protein XRCC1 n=1 Tax=Contarinia nasturtii TaxID=265458 RepID=UPI0012D49185|nr:DNA repair protein XRCC1 [Contarinia nasturtii]
MPDAKIKSVALCSSEDKNYPATNLVNSQKKKWKCEEIGCEKAFVVLQLEKPTKISGIDVGNEHTAIFDVSVGRVGWSYDKYKTILMSSSLMSVTDSRASENPNRVRCFGKDALEQDVVNETWEFVKFNCQQPFNKQVQFGLSFIVIHTPDATSSECASMGNTTETASPKKKKNCDETLNLPKTSVFAQFTMRDDSSDSSDKEASSLFSKWKEEKNSPAKDINNGKQSAAAAIRDASSSNSKLEQCTKINHKIETPTGKAKRSIDLGETGAKRERINRNRPAIMYDDEDENTSKPKFEKLINDDKERIERERKKEENKKGKKDILRDDKSKKKMEQSADKFKTFLQTDMEDKASHSSKTSSTHVAAKDEYNIEDDDDDDDVLVVKQKSPEKFDITADKTDDEEGSEKKESPAKLTPVNPQASSSKSPPPWALKKKRPSTSNDTSASKRSRNSESDDETGGLLRGVVFVISGIQNPHRGEMREKGVEMGAKYQPDWNKSCTHLICAFKNTPKYKQVKGSGIIVNKDWIDDCYAQKKKLPWQDYQL